MMKRRVAIVIGVALAGSVHIAAAAPTNPSNDACGAVAIEEAATVVGANAKSVPNPKGCRYQVPGQSLQLVIRTEPWAGGTDGSYRIHELRKAKWDEGNSRGETAAMNPEPSLGEHATSVQNRDSFYLLVVVKKTLLEIELRDKGKVIPSPLCDKVRLIAKQAASRL